MKGRGKRRKWGRSGGRRGVRNDKVVGVNTADCCGDQWATKNKGRIIKRT